MNTAEVSSPNTSPQQLDLFGFRTAAATTSTPSMSSAGASPASRFRWRDGNKVRLMKDGCGPNSHVSSLSYDPDTCLWRTSPTSSTSAWETSCVIWPRSGTMRNGTVSVPQNLEPPTSGKDSGLWPTPVTSDSRESRRHGYMKKGHAGTTLLDAIDLWPTPISSTGGHRKPDGKRGARLEDKVERPDLWPHKAPYPTPAATAYGSSGNGTGNNKTSRGRPSLETMAKEDRWPTPTQRDYKDGCSVENVPVNALLGRAVEPTKTKGSLNPAFVEYLMGYPSEWTASKPLATASSPR